MISRIKFLTAIDMLFLLLLSLSGSTLGIASEILYYLACLLPVGLMLNHVYAHKETIHTTPLERKEAMLNDLKRDFTLSKKGAALSLPIFFPAISVILAISALTSLLLSSFGYSNATEFNEPFIVALLTHALAPAILEELLFRFAPIKLLEENKRSALILSSLMFAFAHANLFQIPYALVAGFIFSSLYLLTGSILPSVILHFLNNAVSLASMYGVKAPVIVIALAITSVASLTVIFIRRKEYKDEIKKMIGKEKAVLAYTPLFFIATSSVIAISMLFV